MSASPDFSIMTGTPYSSTSSFRSPFQHGTEVHRSVVVIHHSQAQHISPRRTLSPRSLSSLLLSSTRLRYRLAIAICIRSSARRPRIGIRLRSLGVCRGRITTSHLENDAATEEVGTFVSVNFVVYPNHACVVWACTFRVWGDGDIDFLKSVSFSCCYLEIFMISEQQIGGVSIIRDKAREGQLARGER